MKAHHIYFCAVIFILAHFNLTVLAQDSYGTYINAAKHATQEQKYLTAGQLYSKAFSANRDRGAVGDRYNAAQAWAKAGIADSAFYQLNRIAKAGYFSELSKIIIDGAFAGLKGDKRWQDLVNLVRSNSKIKESDLAIVALLDTIRRDDQSHRIAQSLAIRQHGINSAEVEEETRLMLRYDTLNQTRLAQIFTQYGWPEQEIIGDEGNQTIFLVLQHSGLSYRLKYLNFVKDAFNKRKISSSEMALFTDRTDLMQGKKQTYGSQLITDSKTGKTYVQPITDPEHVDERRAAVGLQLMKEYLKQWNMEWNIEEYYKDLPLVKVLTHIN